MGFLKKSFGNKMRKLYTYPARKIQKLCSQAKLIHCTLDVLTPVSYPHVGNYCTICGSGERRKILREQSENEDKHSLKTGFDSLGSLIPHEDHSPLLCM